MTIVVVVVFQSRHNYRPDPNQTRWWPNQVGWHKHGRTWLTDWLIDWPIAVVVVEWWSLSQANHDLVVVVAVTSIHFDSIIGSVCVFVCPSSAIFRHNNVRLSTSSIHSKILPVWASVCITPESLLSNNNRHPSIGTVKIEQIDSSINSRAKVLLDCLPLGNMTASCTYARARAQSYFFV